MRLADVDNIIHRISYKPGFKLVRTGRWLRAQHTRPDSITGVVDVGFGGPGVRRAGPRAIANTPGWLGRHATVSWTDDELVGVRWHDAVHDTPCGSVVEVELSQLARTVS